MRPRGCPADETRRAGRLAARRRVRAVNVLLALTASARPPKGKSGIAAAQPGLVEDVLEKALPPLGWLSILLRWVVLVLSWVRLLVALGCRSRRDGWGWERLRRSLCLSPPRLGISQGFELAAVEKDPAALDALVDVDAAALVLTHVSVTFRTGQSAHVGILSISTSTLTHEPYFCNSSHTTCSW